MYGGMSGLDDHDVYPYTQSAIISCLSKDQVSLSVIEEEGEACLSFVPVLCCHHASLPYGFLGYLYVCTTQTACFIMHRVIDSVEEIT